MDCLDTVAPEIGQSKRDGEPKPVVGGRARGDIPELGDVLQREVHRLASSLATLSTASVWLG